MAETRKSYSFNEEMTGWLSQENRIETKDENH